MKRIFPQTKYPKILLLIATFVIAYFIFYERNFTSFHGFLSSLGYLGSFISGVFFTYGFTAAPATAVFLILAKEQNIFLATIFGGLGALVGDLLIFKFIRFSLSNEIERLSKEKLVMKLNSRIPPVLRKYLFPTLAGIIIASPLPDEIGVSMLASLKHISIKTFLAISFLLNSLGILIILTIGSTF